MYWKEHYTTRTAESYEGYDTIYNNRTPAEFFRTSGSYGDIYPGISVLQK